MKYRTEVKCQKLKRISYVIKYMTKLTRQYKKKNLIAKRTQRRVKIHEIVAAKMEIDRVWH